LFQEAFGTVQGIWSLAVKVVLHRIEKLNSLEIKLFPFINLRNWV
jgi:hypothetical protein